MGLRDRIKGLVRGAVAPVSAGGSAPASVVPPSTPLSPSPSAASLRSVPPQLRIVSPVPRPVAEPPPGALLLAAADENFPGSTLLSPDRWPRLFGPVCVVGPDPAWSAAVAERLCALGVGDVSWLERGA